MCFFCPFRKEFSEGFDIEEGEVICKETDDCFGRLVMTAINFTQNDLEGSQVVKEGIQVSVIDQVFAFRAEQTR